MTGKIVRLHEKGFGFIRDDNDGKEYFFHRSSLKNASWDALRKGDAVEFEDTDEGPKGPRTETVFLS